MNYMLKNEYKDPILELFEDVFPDLNIDQKKAIKTTDGPLLIIAGPGTGKTLVLILRTLYLILTKKAKPSEILLTTFTEKATFELRDRINQIARKLKLNIQLHNLKISTIHGICNEIIQKNLLLTPLNNNYIILDDLTQKLFIYEHFNEIVGEPIDQLYYGKWRYKWNTIKRLAPFFNKISEEMVNPQDLSNSSDIFLQKVGIGYCKYKDLMFENNRVDFSNLQTIFLDLLNDSEISRKTKSNLKYLMIDEYQDTNFIQESIILTLAKPDNNICVVGDEDQSLYRFRGATVRNILEFPKHFENINIIKLLVNYRSHPKIISSYDKFMNSVDWTSKDKKIFRFDKRIIPPPNEDFPNYPAVFCIWGINEKDEADRLAQMIFFLKNNNVIQDYSDVAILLRSVRYRYSKSFMESLDRYNIPYFCPRAKSYFENDEVKIILATFALIFGFHDNHLENYQYKEIIEDGLYLIQKYFSTSFRDFIQRKIEQIKSLKIGETLDLNIIDYFYQILAYKPFSNFIKNENRVRNLSLFSHILGIFQLYYHLPVITFSNKDIIKFLLFNSFFRFLIEGGMDEYEDPDNPVPKGYVQIMTFHQSKGLEFPVVIVGSLDKQFQTQKLVDKYLKNYYSRAEYEPLNRITEFDRARHFYVAFSRAQKILVLSTASQPKKHFDIIWEGLDQWPYVKQQTLKAQKFESKNQFIPKKSYSLTSHINVYETCPRQYLFYKEYEFQPSRTGQVIFGLLVHHTIEDIHKFIIAGKQNQISFLQIEELFNNIYTALLKTGLRALAPTTKESALKQVINYFSQNEEFFKKIKETEIDVSIEKENYIILGVVDLLLESNGKLEIIDFKTQPKPKSGDPILEKYQKQLNVYAYIINEKYGNVPEKLALYWTSEDKRRNAITEYKYDEKLATNIIKEFDKIITKISNKNFKIEKIPKTKICNECDFRFYCTREGNIKLKMH